MNERPTRLVTLSILAMVLAGFGLLSSLSGIASLAVPNYTKRLVPSTSNAKVYEIQQRMAAELTEATKKWRGYQLAVLIGVLLSSIALLIGGIKSLNVQHPGPVLLRTTMALLIPLEVAKTWLALAIASAMSSIMARYTAEIVNVAVTGGRPMPIDPTVIASGISQFATYAGSAFAVVFCVAKIVLYAVSIYYFRRPDVLALFSAQRAPATPPPLAPRPPAF